MTKQSFAKRVNDILAIATNSLLERVGQQLDFYYRRNTLIKNVVYSIDDWCVYAVVLIDFLDTLSGIVTLGNHLHFNLGILYGVALAYHASEYTVAAEL